MLDLNLHLASELLFASVCFAHVFFPFRFCPFCTRAFAHASVRRLSYIALPVRAMDATTSPTRWGRYLHRASVCPLALARLASTVPPLEGWTPSDCPCAFFSAVRQVLLRLLRMLLCPGRLKLSPASLLLALFVPQVDSLLPSCCRLGTECCPLHFLDSCPSGSEEVVASPSPSRLGCCPLCSLTVPCLPLQVKLGRRLGGWRP